MAHFYGTLQGGRGQASRLGSKGSGLQVCAASWQGSVHVDLDHDEETGEDIATVRLAPWHGQGKSRILYQGPVSGKGIK